MFKQQTTYNLKVKNMTFKNHFSILVTKFSAGFDLRNCGLPVKHIEALSYDDIRPFLSVKTILQKAFIVRL